MMNIISRRAPVSSNHDNPLCQLQTVIPVAIASQMQNRAAVNPLAPDPRAFSS
jgi:hypothetical protein